MVTHIDILFYIYLYLFIFIFLLFIYLNTYLPILVLYHYIISSQKILANDLLRLFLLHFAPPFSFSFSSVTLGLVRKLSAVKRNFHLFPHLNSELVKLPNIVLYEASTRAFLQDFFPLLSVM